MFKTARFKIHNPSRHKIALLSYAMKHYHLTLKRVLEQALTDPNLVQQVSLPDKKGRSRVNRYQLGKYLYTITPKGWVLAPLRDYLIGDAGAMLLSHLKKQEKAKNLSNPPTLHGLAIPDAGQRTEIVAQFAKTVAFAPKPHQQEKIRAHRDKGEPGTTPRIFGTSSRSDQYHHISAWLS